jgi:hypothetical protein
VRPAIRSISAAAIAAACLALAACTSGSSGNAAAGQQSAAAAGQGRPASGGTVTVKQGKKVICVMTVVNGTGTCKVPAKNFGIGTSQISARYAGGGKLSGRSDPVSMTVATAPTTTTLTLSPAKVSYGSEQAGRLAVKVTAAYGGTPTGTVKVTSGGTTACLITLAPAQGGAQGSCTLPARKLAAGARPLTAIYVGDHWYRGSVSANKTLTVTQLSNGTGAPAPTGRPNPLSSVTLSDKPQVSPVRRLWRTAGGRGR